MDRKLANINTISLMTSAILSVIIIFNSTSISIAHSPIITDGSTNTSVSQNSNNGKITVIPAPVENGNNSRISMNNYTNFNVPKPGVDFDNTGVQAKTIINQVTSTNPSLLQGQLAVLGPAANFLILNPNGIEVNGATFINTPNLLLGTGTRSYVDSPDSTGLLINRDNVITTNIGSIVIESGGMSGTFNHLEIIAKSILVDGAIINNNKLGNDSITLRAGSSVATLDSTLQLQNAASLWAKSFITANNTDVKPAEFLIDITSRSSIKGGSISLVVTDKGVGVRSSSNIAAAGNFNIDNDGEVVLNGTNIVAGGDIIIGSLATSSNLSPENIGFTNGSLSIDNSTLIASGNIITKTASTEINSSNAQSIIKAGSVAYANDNSGKYQLHGGLLIETSNGDIINKGGLLQGNVKIDSESDSKGGITLISAGKVINQSIDQNRVAGIYGYNVITSNMGDYIPNQQGDVYLYSKDIIENLSGVINSNKQIFINPDKDYKTAPDFVNETLYIKPSDYGVYRNFSYHDKRIFFILRKVTGFDVEYDAMQIPNVLAAISANGNININARNISNIGGNINAGDTANKADINIFTDNLLNQTLLTGSAHYERLCAWFCDERGNSDMQSNGGGIISSNNINLNQEITKATLVINDGGVVQATNSLNLNSSKVIAKSETILSYTSRERGLSSLDRGTYGKIIRTDRGGLFIATNGTINIDNDSPIELDGGLLLQGQISATPLGMITAEEINYGSNIINNGVIIRKKPASDTNIVGKTIGLFGGAI